MKIACPIIAVPIILLHLQHSFAQSDTYANEVMAGISNKGQNTDKPYLTAGDRAYIVGTQDGNFPDLGSHVQGEMGGLWMPPVKLLGKGIFQHAEKSWLRLVMPFTNKPIPCFQWIWEDGGTPETVKRVMK